MRYNYIEILNSQVEIPIIQRDYAQGRTDSRTKKIRKNFLNFLFDFIRSKHSKDGNSEIELDFIYGFKREVKKKETSAFVPIDGQQRLTTLWLLYWFISAKENVQADEKRFLNNLLYETRHSTTEFFRYLTKFNPDFSSNEISREIKNQAWYFDIWDYDPSVQSVLVVLDDIQERYEKLKIYPVWELIGGSACPFYFYKLDMEKIGLKDDLYIKMNSRGKILTEFEYFKSFFPEQLSDPEQKKRFEKSIDGHWIETVWQIARESDEISENEDIALIVDNAFLNLFNFITSVIFLKNNIKTKNGSRYIDTETTEDLIDKIYKGNLENQKYLFDTLDAISDQHKNDRLFWSEVFYFAKDDFDSSKTRLFFRHEEVNLLKRCLFNFSEDRDLTFSEQILLLACFTQLKNKKSDFKNRIRTIRNLTVNSENELREDLLGYSFDETETYINNGDMNVFKTFKTDQIKEEMMKKLFLSQHSADTEILNKLEDSDLLRGCILLFPLDNNFGNRVKKFLEIFEEHEMIVDFGTKSDLLLCFGDYSQTNRSSTNLMSASSTIIRDFLTIPGINKEQFYSNTQTVILDCLDYFIDNPSVTVSQKIQDTLTGYAENPKDWRYYFMKYSSFREECKKGYYNWDDENYCLWKMHKQYKIGHYWDPFLYELKYSEFLNKTNLKLTLDDYGSKLFVNLNNTKISISSLPNGFLFKNEMSDDVSSSLISILEGADKINNSGELVIPQNSEGIDLKDRIEIVKQVLKGI